ncbi:hypothetical protein RPW65_11095 [Pseudomonas sp. NyZ704]|nr:hypothetical protein RPW65_11095 [Pseudomonas sp. NyZ704]
MSHEQTNHQGTWAMNRLRLLLIGCCMLACAVARADTLLVVIPEPSSLTEEFVERLREQRRYDDVLVHSLASSSSAPDASRVITMGSRSLQWRLDQKHDTPTIATYISRSTLTDLGISPLAKSVQILLANPAPSRQLRLAQLLIPRIENIGALFSQQHQAQLAEWEQSATTLGLNLVSMPLNKQAQLGRQMIDLLDRSDVLVALDDPNIYNADNLKTILLSSYTRNKVLIGPSAPFINAGSLSTTYSTPEQMAQSVDDLLDAPWHGGVISYPRYFSVLSNAQVARSLGFPPPDDDALSSQLRQQEVGQ